MTTFIDSSAWIDHLAGRDLPHVHVLRQILSTEEVAVCDLVVLEVLQGIPSETDFQRARREFEALSVHSTGGLELALAAAANYRTLRARGATVRSSIDCLIATYVLSVDGELLDNDRDYDPFEAHLGLRRVSATPQ